MNTPSEILDRLPPQDQHAEQCVIGSMIHDPRVIDDLSLSDDDFYSDANGRLYRHLTAMRREERKIDAVLIRDRLAAAGDLEVIGGMAYLADVCQSVPYAAHVASYAAIVLRCSRCRQLIRAATETLRDAWQVGADPLEVLDAAEKSLAQIGTSDFTGALVTAEQAAIRFNDKVDAIYRREKQAGMLTGMDAFDQQFGGLFGGEFIVLAARLGVGKTSLACQWVADIAARQHLSYFGSLEMDATELSGRMICTIAGVSGNKIRNATLDQDDMAKLVWASNDFARRNILIDERPKLKVADIRRETIRLLRHGLKFVVVDYSQKITPANHKDSREQQVAQIARDLKTLARELKVPVVSLAQLNRAKTAIDGTGGAEDLRESDVLGQEADVVIRIDTNAKGEYWFRVVKDRNGPTGKLQVTFDADLTTFAAYHRDEPPAEREQGFDQYDGRDNF
jgi:replicative DNA helicase